MSTGVVREGGLLLGPWERPRNIASNRGRGSIHDDETAKKLGFRGAFVSGRVHLGTFVPLLLEAFGNRWFESGTLSVEFRSGTLDQEEVRAVLGEPPNGAADAQVECLLESPAGEVVAIGTASVGRTSEPTWLGSKNVSAYDKGPYGLVSAVSPGDRFPRVEVTLSATQAERLALGTVALPWYTSESPWGLPIASPALMVTALGMACGAYLRDHPITGVAIDGATELRNIRGPILVGQPYFVSGEIIARGRSPRTEYFWYEAQLEDQSGVRIAEMRLQWRCVRNSAELEAAAGARQVR